MLLAMARRLYVFGEITLTLYELCLNIYNNDETDVAPKAKRFILDAAMIAT